MTVVSSTFPPVNSTPHYLAFSLKGVNPDFTKALVVASWVNA
jgi:hypothetical protein